MEALDAAGFIPALRARGFQEKNGAKFMRGDEVCDFNFDEAFTPGWSWTWQVQRADFDHTLAKDLIARGVSIDFATQVTCVTIEGGRSRVTVKDANGDESTIEARFVIDASGYGRVLPRLLKLDRVSGQHSRRAVFGHFTDPRREQVSDEPNRIQIVSCKQPGMWAWVIPFSTGTTSVGFVGPHAIFEACGATPEEQMNALIAEEVHTATRFAGCERVFGPRAIEGWSVTTDRLCGEGYALAGNATEFLDPVFSSGVTLGVVSGQRTGELAARQLLGEQVDWQREYVEPTLHGVDVFRVYVDAWYDGTLEEIFYAPNPDPDVIRKICSVLAGYVWDLENPYVRKGARALAALRARVQAEAQAR